MPSRRTLGGFYVHRQIGGGAAGTVFVVTRAEERNDPQADRFALKVPDYDATAARSLSEADFLKLFRDEAGALLALPEHENLARFVTFDAGARPKPILVMELVQGARCDKVIASRLLTLEGSFGLLDGVLAGLGAMHGVGVGHLDLKPSNVIVREGLKPVLVDFGLAGRHLRPGCGTSSYGAPEVWGVLPDNGNATPMAADLYSFGCLAYEVLTGETLFDAPNEVALITAHLMHDGLPAPIKKLADRPVTAGVAAVLRHCLRKGSHQAGDRRGDPRRDGEGRRRHRPEELAGAGVAGRAHASFGPRGTRSVIASQAGLRRFAGMRNRFFSLGSLSLVLAVTGYACGSGTSDHTTAGTAGHGGGTGSGGSDTGVGGGAGGGDGGLFTNHGNVVSLAVSPATSTIDVVNGVVKPVPFTATATYADKFTGVVAAAWSFDQLPIALIDGSGNLTPSGTLGGHGTVTATFSGLTGTASVDVILQINQNPAMLSSGNEGLFGTPDQNPSGTLLYPYDETVFARGLLPPELQWSGGTAGDAYLVHVSEKYLDAQFYINADPPSRFTVPAAVWTQLTQSNAGEPVTLDIQRLSAGVAHQSMHEAWTIAQGSLRGSIYYWTVNTGQLMKIAPGAATPTLLFDSGSNTVARDARLRRLRPAPRRRPGPPGATASAASPATR